MRRVCEPALAVNVRIGPRDGLERERPEQDGYRRWGVHLDVMSGREQEEVRVGQQLVEAGRNAEAGSRRWQALGSVAAVVAEYRNHNEADVSTGRTRTSECRWPSRTREPAACKAPADPSDRLTPAVFRFVACRACLQASSAVTAPAWLAIDADVVVTEARIVGSGFGRWPPAGHRIAGRRTRTERRHVPQVWAGPSGQSRCPRKGHCFLGVFQLERVLSSCWAVSRSGRDASYGRESLVVPGEGSDSTRVRRFARGPSDETVLQLLERIGDAYGLVLVLILTTFVVTMTLPPQGWAGRVVAVAIAGLTAIIALTSSDVRLGRVRFAVGAALVAVIATALGRVLSSDALLGAAFVVDSLLLAVAAATILRRVVLAAQVDFRTILGAISVFTLLGLLFGFLFIALGRLVAGDVFAGVSHAQARDYLFFSYTTLTTTGYGNLVPAGDIGQILSVFEMLTGQVFLVTLVAGLVSLWRPGARVAESADEKRP